VTNTSVRVLAFIPGLGRSLIVGVTGCADDRYHQSTGHFKDLPPLEHSDNPNADQRLQDSRTAERVREAMAAGADYKYDGVKVIARNGVVQLSGFVNTNAQRNSAEEVTRKVAGVKGVENNLTVKD
jgi:hyperosmotically inducible periplasmic protein